MFAALGSHGRRKLRLYEENLQEDGGNLQPQG
jgi:hypothetical protein